MIESITDISEKNMVIKSILSVFGFWL